MNAHDAVRRVLVEAAAAENFFDLSDAQRLEWMIQRGFKLGRKVARDRLYPIHRDPHYFRHWRPTRWKGERRY